MASGGVPSVPTGRKVGVFGNIAGYDGHGAAGFGITGVLYDTQTYSVQANGAFGVGFDTGVVGGRGGVWIVLVGHRLRRQRSKLEAVMRWFALALARLVPAAAAAQRRPPVQQPAPAAQPNSTWDTLPRMQLERQFAGPLRDTVVQRWRDPADGTICYIYLPISAQHSPPTAAGFVNYGSNSIGSISCLPGPAARATRPQELPAKANSRSRGPTSFPRGHIAAA